MEKPRKEEKEGSGEGKEEKHLKKRKEATDTGFLQGEGKKERHSSTQLKIVLQAE